MDQPQSIPSRKRSCPVLDHVMGGRQMNPDFLPVFAAGNLGESELPSTLSSPAVAKNCVAVGADPALSKQGLGYIEYSILVCSWG